MKHRTFLIGVGVGALSGCIEQSVEDGGDGSGGSDGSGGEGIGGY